MISANNVSLRFGKKALFEEVENANWKIDKTKIKTKLFFLDNNGANSKNQWKKKKSYQSN